MSWGEYHWRQWDGNSWYNGIFSPVTFWSSQFFLYFKVISCCKPFSILCSFLQGNALCRNSIDGILIQYKVNGSDKKFRLVFRTRTCDDTGLVPTHILTKPRAPLLNSLCCVIIQNTHLTFTVGYNFSPILVILTFPESNLSNLKKVTAVEGSSGLLSPLYHLTSELTSPKPSCRYYQSIKQNSREYEDSRYANLLDYLWKRAEGWKCVKNEGCWDYGEGRSGVKKVNILFWWWSCQEVLIEWDGFYPVFAFFAYLTHFQSSVNNLNILKIITLTRNEWKICYFYFVSLSPMCAI